MSRNQLIPRPHWSIYLKAVSRRFYEQPVSLALEESGAPDRAIAHDLYFMGVSLEGGHRPAVSLQMAQLGHPENHLTHRIAAPTLLVRELDEHGQLDRLIVEDDQHRRTVIAFCEAPTPGIRHSTPHRATEQCDHPRCPLA